MPFYIRKSFKLGLLRFNLSKSGIGASAGVTGLRVGAGPKGRYLHAGRSGLYFRKRLGSDQREPAPEAGNTATDARPPKDGLARWIKGLLRGR